MEMESIVQGNNRFDGIEPRWRWICCPEPASSVFIILCLTACAKDLKSLFEADRQTIAAETYDSIALQGALEKMRENWIPVFSYEGDWTFEKCYEDSRAAGPVGFFFLEAGEPVYVYVSLTTLLLTSAAWFDAGAVSWDREMEGMVEDVRQQNSLYQEYNEGATFPYHVD